jgi:hypothetical protein
MADFNFIEFKFEDESNIRLKIRRYERAQKQRAQNLLEDIGEHAKRHLQAVAPRDQGYLYRHIDRSAIQFYPGGAGGGGEYRTTVGIKRGTSKHPFYVEQGTGIYGDKGAMITPISHSHMTFYGEGAGRILHKKTVKGQKAQRFFYSTWNEVQGYAAGRMLAQLRPFE